MTLRWGRADGIANAHADGTLAAGGGRRVAVAAMADGMQEQHGRRDVDRGATAARLRDGEGGTSGDFGKGGYGGRVS